MSIRDFKKKRGGGGGGGLGGLENIFLNKRGARQKKFGNHWTDGITRTLHARSFFHCLIWNDTGYSARRHLCACIWRAHATNTVSFPHSFDSRLWRGGDVMRASETSPVWCGHKDVLHLNKRNPFQEKETEAAVVNGVANPSPAPALIALNIFAALIWKN